MENDKSAFEAMTNMEDLANDLFEKWELLTEKLASDYYQDIKEED